MLRLELEHPKVAFRDCGHCRKYYYDEKTGKARELHGELLERVKPPPCERPEGCPKGHWSKPLELEERHLPVVQMVELVRVTHGRCLTQEMLANRWLLEYVARIDEVMEHGEQGRRNQMLAASLVAALAPAAMAGAVKGRGKPDARR